MYSCFVLLFQVTTEKNKDEIKWREYEFIIKAYNQYKEKINGTSETHIWDVNNRKISNYTWSSGLKNYIGANFIL